MRTIPETRLSLEQLVSLPTYAQYLLQHRVDDFVAFQLSLSREVKVPMMKFFEHLSHEKMMEISRQGVEELLGALAENRAQQQIDNAIRLWEKNQLPIVDMEDLVADDITLITYVRKRAFLHFLPEYTTSSEKILELVKEIDCYHNELMKAATNTYVSLLKKKVSDHAHLIEQVNNTIPGAVYLFDLKNFKGLFSNNKLPAIIGYSHKELNELGEHAILKLLHPEDQLLFRNHLDALSRAKDGEIVVVTYRIRDKNGRYKWVSNHESVFKRDEKGTPIQTIGITLDVDKEQRIAESLRKNEALHRQAESITHIGSYTWNLKTNQIHWSEELFRIYGLPYQQEPMHFDFLQSFTHPDDRAMTQKQTEASIAERRNYDFYFRITANDGKSKILHARGQLLFGKNGEPDSILGTVQDVTEKQTLIRKLRHNESIYRQAEELANMGNWSWDIRQDKLEWTDHLYRIYGMEPQSEQMSIDRFLSFVHPEDRPQVDKGVQEVFTNDLLDYTFRIITPDGKVKILRSVAQVHRDKQGNPVFVIGTERDITEKQIMIDRLQQSQSLYKQAQSLARLGNWSLDLLTKEFIWSDEMYQIYEMEKGNEVNFDDWAKFIHPDEAADVLAYFDECIREKKYYDKVHRLVLSNGKVKTIHRKGELIFNDQGNPVKMIGTTQDVTEEYRVQQELKENQTFIQKITNATPSIIASYNINTGRYVFISEGLEKLLGYPTSLVMEQGVGFFAGIIHPEDAPEVMEKNTLALEEANRHPEKNDFVVEFTYRMRHRNGKYRWFHTYGTIFDRNNEQKVEHVLNISLDVTEQMEATEKIKEQEHFIQQLADASPTILYLFDVPRQSIGYINREIFFVLGYLPEEILEKEDTITDWLYHPEDLYLLPGRRQSGKNFQQVDSMIQFECRMKNKEGEWRWLLVREIVFKTDEHGKISQILGAALDINRRKEMEKTILQNTLLLEQSNASLEEFAYVASHDLKEPLRKISTFGDRMIASQMDQLTPEGKIYLKKIVDASQRMQTMISDLLSISMISGNTAFETFSLQKILDETLQTLEFKIEQQNAVIQSDPLPEAKIIPSQFRQLFQNLLSNSLKFVREGVQPVITITYARVSNQDMVHYQLARAEQYHRILIQDNGIGFENEFAGKIFAIFQRLHGRSEYEGSGIGLAICKKIVEHHGGIIYASGVPDQGATFTIILPA